MRNCVDPKQYSISLLCLLRKTFTSHLYKLAQGIISMEPAFKTRLLARQAELQTKIHEARVFASWLLPTTQEPFQSAWSFHRKLSVRRIFLPCSFHTELRKPLCVTNRLG
jgi:hypothetical protein